MNVFSSYSHYKWYGVPGEDYPRPMVKHEVVSKENIARHKKAYDAGLSYIFQTVLKIPFFGWQECVGNYFTNVRLLCYF